MTVTPYQLMLTRSNHLHDHLESLRACAGVVIVIVIVVIIVIIVAIVIIALSSSNHLFCSVIPDSSN